MIRKVIVVLVLLNILACKPKDEPPLPEKELTNFILDLRIQEGIVRQYPIEKRDSMRHIWHEEVLDIHNVDEQKYEEIQQYLEQNPDKYFKIEEDIQERLQQLNNQSAPANNREG